MRCPHSESATQPALAVRGHFSETEVDSAMNLLLLSAVAMTLTALAHSFVGEKKLIGPLLAANIDLLSGYRGNLVRFAWHFTSLLMMTSALLVASSGSPVHLVKITGAIWLLAGVLDAVLTRGKHIGWPLLTAAGLLALLGN
jgi:hypothetical protein